MHKSKPALTTTQQTPASNTFDFSLRVYYEDTDAGGIVYYANYLRFCERARSEWLRSFGLSQQKMFANKQALFVVRDISARYVSPARLDDSLTVISRITTLKRASLSFEQRIERKSERVFESLTTIAYLDFATQRPTALPDDLYNQFKKTVTS